MDVIVPVLTANLNAATIKKERKMRRKIKNCEPIKNLKVVETALEKR